MSTRTALIAGASGLVGSHCLPALLDSYEHVIAVGRRPLAFEHPRLEQRVIDFDTLPTLEFRANDVFSTLGGLMRGGNGWETFRRVEVDYPRMLAQRAAENGAQQFLFVSTVDAYVSPAYIRYTRMRRELERAVVQMPFTCIHIFRPGLLVGQREQRRRGEELTANIMRLAQWTLVGPLAKYHPIDGRDVGRAMVAAAAQGAAGVHVYTYLDMRRLAATADSSLRSE